MKKLLVLVLLFLCVSGIAQEFTDKDFSHPTSKVQVIVFMGIDCPISQQYVRIINELREKYSPADLSIQAIIPGKADKADVAAFVAEYKPAFPVNIDRKYFWVRKLKATVTPEVFVFDQHQQLKYQGAIDDWYFQLGKHRTKASQHFLNDAISQLLHGATPSIGETKAVGCIIQTPGK